MWVLFINEKVKKNLKFRYILLTQPERTEIGYFPEKFDYSLLRQAVDET